MLKLSRHTNGFCFLFFYNWQSHTGFWIKKWTQRLKERSWKFPGNSDFCIYYTKTRIHILCKLHSFYIIIVEIMISQSYEIMRRQGTQKKMLNKFWQIPLRGSASVLLWTGLVHILLESSCGCIIGSKVKPTHRVMQSCFIPCL